MVIAPGDRSDVLLAMVNAHEAEGFPSLAGIIMNGGLLPHPAIAKLVAGLKPRLPILTTGLGTFDTASAARADPWPGGRSVRSARSTPR